VFGLVRQFIQSPDSPSGFVLTFLYYRLGYGQFLSANVFAYLAEMCLGLVVGLMLGGGARRNQIFVYLSIGMVVWTTLVLSNSRGGLLAFTCEFMFIFMISLAWYSERRLFRSKGQSRFFHFIHHSKLARLGATALLAVIIIAGILWMGGDELATKIAGRNAVARPESSDAPIRKEIWRSSWQLIQRAPLTGTGLGTFYLAIPQFQSGSGRIKIEQAHNDYLDLAASGGIVGLGLAVWFGAMLIWRAKSAWTSRDAYRRASCLGAAGALVAVAVHSSMDFGLQVTGIAVYCAALMVILIADHRAGRGKSQSNKLIVR